MEGIEGVESPHLYPPFARGSPRRNQPDPSPCADRKSPHHSPCLRKAPSLLREGGNGEVNPLLRRLAMRYVRMVLWLTPPPYLRRIVACLALLVAVVFDLAGRATVDHPFLTETVTAGSPVGAEVIEYRAVPVGMLPTIDDPSGFAARSLHAGDPLTPSALSTVAPPPRGWWSIPAALPAGTAVGDRVRLIAADPALDVVGVVSGLPATVVLGGDSEGMVAVPPEAAAAVAAAVTRRTLTVLVGT